MKEYLEKQADGSYKLVCGVGVNDLPNLTRINGKTRQGLSAMEGYVKEEF